MPRQLSFIRVAIRHTFTIAGLLTALTTPAVTPHAHAAITVTGDVSPVYNGTDDPWDLGSDVLHFGVQSFGTLTIDNGSVVDTVPFIGSSDPPPHSIGTGENSHAVVTVNGPGSTLNLGYVPDFWDQTPPYVRPVRLFMGAWSGSTGTLNVLNGGTASSGYISAGFSSGESPGGTGTINVSGSGSVLNANAVHLGGAFKAEQISAGTLNVNNGGVVNSYHVGIGTYKLFSSSQPLSIGLGTANIFGEGSALHVENQIIVATHSTLNIAAGATVETYTNPNIRTNWQREHALWLGGTLNLSGGLLDMHNAGIDKADFPNATFNFTGGKLKDVYRIDIGSDFVQRGGTFAPGGATGDSTQILSDYLLTAGTVEIESGGVDGPTDAIHVEGDIDINPIGTTLDIRALGPIAGTFTILEASGSLTGKFENITSDGIDNNLIGVEYTPNAVILTLSPPVDYLPGDLDGNGIVDLADLSLILNHWDEQPPDVPEADVDGDGVVGIADLSWVLNNWNNTLPPANAASSIPEPGSVVLLSLGVLGATTRRRRS